MLQNYRNFQIWNTSVFSPSVSPNFFTLFLDSFFGLLCFRFRLTGVSSIILFRARTLVVLRHGVLANWLVECFSLVVPNMVLSKLNIPKLVSQHTRGRYTFQPLWVSGWCVCTTLSNDFSTVPHLVLVSGTFIFPCWSQATHLGRHRLQYFCYQHFFMRWVSSGLIAFWFPHAGYETAS